MSHLPLHLDVLICEMGGKQSSFEGSGFTAVMQEMIPELQQCSDMLLRQTEDPVQASQKREGVI